MRDMQKMSITDRGWMGDAFGHSVFLAAAGVVLYVWTTSMRPFPNHLISALVYYGALIALVGAVAKLIALGFTYRRTDINGDGLVVHEAYYGIFWRQLVIPKSQVLAIEPYDDMRQTMFARAWVSGIRIRRSGDSPIVLSEREGQARFQHEVAEIRRLLEVA